MKALVTGAAGAVGSALCTHLRAKGHEVVATDIDEMDVTRRWRVFTIIEKEEPDVVFHLAAEKLAIEGELDPAGFALVNISGTRNVCDAARVERSKIVFASTCKAADPETAYGASKLIAERIVLNAGGVVVRFFNIPEAGPSVFTIWEATSKKEPIPYTDCWRYFCSLERSIEFMSRAAEFPPGRYALDPGPSLHMREVAKARYPERDLIEIPRRRGDRDVELVCAKCETVEHRDDHMRIVGAHDPVPAHLKVAA